MSCIMYYMTLASEVFRFTDFLFFVNFINHNELSIYSFGTIGLTKQELGRCHAKLWEFILHSTEEFLSSHDDQ